PKLAGLILLAGNTRPLTALSVEQNEYFLSLLPNPTDRDKKKGEDLKKQIERISAPKLADMAKPAENILGLSVAYWLAMRDYDPAAIAARLKMPLLVLQGERDYQVTMEDFKGWKGALEKRDNVTLKS